MIILVIPRNFISV